MRAIDADALTQLLQTIADDEWNKNTPAGSWSNAYDEMILHVEDMLTIEPEPQIVRCKDCKFYRRDGCFFSTAETIEDGFCNWAERKDGSCHEPST